MSVPIQYFVYIPKNARISVDKRYYFLSHYLFHWRGMVLSLCPFLPLIEAVITEKYSAISFEKKLDLFCTCTMIFTFCVHTSS